MNSRYFTLLLLILLQAQVQAQQTPTADFEISPASITFSNPTPVEGEEITIYVEVKNIGAIPPTLNEDVVVDLYEGPPETNPLQILCKDVILGLEPGKSDRIEAQWRPASGMTEIYAIVNPAGALLFRTSLQLGENLGKGRLPANLRQAFKQNGISLSNNVTVLDNESPWRIKDTDHFQLYKLQKAGDQLEVYSRKKKEIRELNRDNNVAHTAITAAQRTFPQATPAQIQNAIQKGVAWLRAQQGRHSRTCLQCGTDNQLISICAICSATLKGLPEEFVPGAAWDFGEENKQETALALQALLGAGTPVSDPIVQKALKFLIEADWNQFDAYQCSVIIPTFVATKDPKYRPKTQAAIDRLIQYQISAKGNEYSDERDDGGWGYGATADGAHMNMAIYALYAAKQWGLNVPPDTWTRAEKWVRNNQTETGGWVYNLVEEGSPWGIGVYGSMTATGLWVLKACNVPLDDTQIQNGLKWVRKYWSLTRNPGALSWQHYYWATLQRFCDLPPKMDELAGHNWFEEIANMLVAEQQPDGRWKDSQGDFLATCFAIMSLTRTIPQPAQPDLGAVDRSLRFSPPSPRVGEPAHVSVTLTNTGAALDKIINVDFYDGNPDRGGQKIISQVVIFSQNLNETTVSINWIPPSEGEHQIFVVVDPDKQVDDLDLTNNVTSQSVTIRAKSADPIDQKQPFKQVGEGVYQFGNVIVNVNKREVTMTGEINIVNRDTIIEFFACGKLGKTHESMLMIDAEPLHIQLALLRLNMDAGMNLTVQGDPHIPEGDPAEIWVTWERGGETIRHRAEQLIWNILKDHPMQQTHWVFTGGRIINNQFTPQVFHNMIATYRDPDSLFNHPLPGGKDDRTYRVNTNLLPPKGTKVKLIIHPTSP